MAERIDIERALQDLISNEETFRFQGLAVALAQFRWRELIACERHKDHGLDAYASPQSAPNGVGKGLSASITPTLKKIEDDAETAKEHYGPFSLLIFATPHKVSKEKEHPWAEEVRKKYGYELVVISREDIISLLQIPENAWMCRTHLRIPLPDQSPINDTLRLLREAAKEEAGLWATHVRLSKRPFIQLVATKAGPDGGRPRELVSTADLRLLVAQGRKVILEAPAGRGKTTTLIQLAQSPDESGNIPILVDLPGWIQSGLDILEYVAQVSSFRSRGISAAALAQVFREEAPQFLLNGWNEVTSVLSENAATKLRSLVRSYPGAGIVVATRAHHITPSLPDAIRVRLLRVSPDQRLNYLAGALGATRGTQLDSQLRDDPVLSDLTTTPFILSGVTTLVESGQEVPRTRLGLIRAIIALAEQLEEHAGPLQSPPLRGQADDYLRALASHMTVEGAVLVPDASARTVCTAVSERLHASGQISARPDPADLLTALTAHHLLDRVDQPVVSYRFAHQQFQEFYAALTLAEELSEMASQGNPVRTEAFVSRFINQPAWQEPICMVAEDLATSSMNSAQGDFLIEGALRVDPLFAAELSRVIGPAAQGPVKAELGRRLRLLYALPDQQYRQLAIAAMLATGSAEFADVLMPLLTHADQQVRLGTYRAGREFHPSSIGPDWVKTVSNWTEELRAEFVLELAMHHRQPEVALTLARTDPSERVKLAALQSLIWIGLSDETVPFFEAMTDAAFASAISDFHAEEIPTPLKSRATSAYRQLLEQTDDPRARLKITFALADLGDADTVARFKSELGRLPGDIAKELGGHSLRPALDLVQRSDPQWVSDWVAQRIAEGILWPDHWLSFVTALDASWTDQLLRRICTEDLHQSRSGGVIAIVQAIATAGTASTLFAELRNREDAVFAGTASEAERSIYHQIQRLLRSLSPGIIIDGISEILERPVQAEDLGIITDLFSPPGSAEHVHLISSINPAQRQKLRTYLVSAVPVVLARDDFRGEVKGHLSTALAEVGEIGDAARLMELIRADLVRVREGRAARARGEKSPRANGSPMSWSGWHVQALVRLLGRDSEVHLVELLAEPEYELDAAWGLTVIARIDEPGPNAITAARHGNIARDYRLLGGTPPDWSAAFDDQRRRRFASAIRSRIDTVFLEREGVDQKGISDYRLKDLAAALATLDPTGEADRVLEIAELTSRTDGWQRLRLLESLVFAGLLLPTDRAFATLEPVLQQFRKYGINNDGHLLNRLLCLLPFIDDPVRGIAKLRELLAEFRLAPFNERSLLMSLARCGHPAGLELLREFATDNTPVFQHSAKEWVEAVSACDTPEAEALLLSLVDPQHQSEEKVIPVSEYAIDLLASRIVDLARRKPQVARRIYELCAQPISEQQRVILAKVVAWLGSEEALLAGLNLISDASSNAIPYDLRKGIEDVVLETHYLFC